MPGGARARPRHRAARYYKYGDGQRVLRCARGPGNGLPGKGPFLRRGRPANGHSLRGNSPARGRTPGRAPLPFSPMPPCEKMAPGREGGAGRPIPPPGTGPPRRAEKSIRRRGGRARQKGAKPAARAVQGRQKGGKPPLSPAPGPSRREGVSLKAPLPRQRQIGSDKAARWGSPLRKSPPPPPGGEARPPATPGSLPGGAPTRGLSPLPARQKSAPANKPGRFLLCKRSGGN